MHKIFVLNHYTQGNLGVRYGIFEDVATVGPLLLSLVVLTSTVSLPLSSLKVSSDFTHVAGHVPRSMFHIRKLRIYARYIHIYDATPASTHSFPSAVSSREPNRTLSQKQVCPPSTTKSAPVI